MKEKYQEALREAAAQFLAREANRQALLTVTRAEISDDQKRALIYITVLPDDQEEHALKFANRNRGEFGKYLQKSVRGMRVPTMEFMIDLGEKNRRRLDELSS